MKNKLGVKIYKNINKIDGFAYLYNSINNYNIINSFFHSQRIIKGCKFGVYLVKRNR